MKGAPHCDLHVEDLEDLEDMHVEDLEARSEQPGQASSERVRVY
jgi:hypothetical protein